MSRSAFAATQNKPASRYSASDFHIPRFCVPSSATASSRFRAARRAPVIEPACASGDHPAPAHGVSPSGSYTRTSPCSARQPIVAAIRSAFTDERIAGPSHSRIPATAATVLPDRDGPISATAPVSPCRRRTALRRGMRLACRVVARHSVATNRRPNRPRMKRPGTGPVDEQGP